MSHCAKIRTDNIYILINNSSSILSGSELANSVEVLEEGGGGGGINLVLSLYEALRSGDVETVTKLLGTDLEWWFHGPPAHQFMMRLLTAGSTKPQQQQQQQQQHSFEFIPQSVAIFGSTVLVEGCHPSRSISWIHAWTVDSHHGIITQLREYFNTSLTVTRLANANALPSSSSSSLYCPSIWESTLSDQAGKSVPGLVLAI